METKKAIVLVVIAILFASSVVYVGVFYESPPDEREKLEFSEGSSWEYTDVENEDDFDYPDGASESGINSQEFGKESYFTNPSGESYTAKYTVDRVQDRKLVEMSHVYQDDVPNATNRYVEFTGTGDRGITIERVRDRSTPTTYEKYTFNNKTNSVRYTGNVPSGAENVYGNQMPLPAVLNGAEFENASIKSIDGSTVAVYQFSSVDEQSKRAIIRNHRASVEGSSLDAYNIHNGVVAITEDGFVKYFHYEITHVQIHNTATSTLKVVDEGETTIPDVGADNRNAIIVKNVSMTQTGVAFTLVGEDISESGMLRAHGPGGSYELENTRFDGEGRYYLMLKDGSGAELRNEKPQNWQSTPSDLQYYVESRGENGLYNFRIYPTL